MKLILLLTLIITSSSITHAVVHKGKVQTQKAVPVRKLPAKVREISSFAEAEKIIGDGAGTMVVIVLDNTLIKYEPQMARRQWFYYRIQKHLDEGQSYKQAAAAALAEWTAVINLVKPTLVDPNTVEVIARLQSKGIPLLVLTSRGIGLSSRTAEDLALLGFDFNPKNIPDLPITIGDKLILYRGGVLAISGVNRLVALRKFAAAAGISEPKKLVMISDDMNSLDVLAEGFSINARNTEFVPLRLTLMDKELAAFNPKIGDLQFARLTNFLSNEEAERELSKSR